MPSSLKYFLELGHNLLLIMEQSKKQENRIHNTVPNSEAPMFPVTGFGTNPPFQFDKIGIGGM